MGTTTKFVFPYPEITDTPDIPTDMQELAVAIEGAPFTKVHPCIEYRTAGTFTANQGWTSPVPLDQVVQDNDPEDIMPLPATGTVHVLQPGFYIFNYRMHWATAADEHCLLIRINGVDSAWSYNGNLVSVTDSLILTIPILVASSVQLHAYQLSTGTTSGNTALLTITQIVKL